MSDRNLILSGSSLYFIQFIKFRSKLMSVEERAKAAAKNIEGKAQDAMGNVTGDIQDQVEGKAKQVEANARNAKEDIKDEVKKNIDHA